MAGYSSKSVRCWTCRCSLAYSIN